MEEVSRRISITCCATPAQQIANIPTSCDTYSELSWLTYLFVKKRKKLFIPVLVSVCM